MKLTQEGPKRNDRRDISTAELLLIRSGHHLWAEFKKARKSGNVHEEKALDAALETIWAHKRAIRAELAAERARESERLRSYFEARRAA